MTDRTCLPVMDWPSIDRELWQRARADSDLLEDGGLAEHWRPDTVRKVEKAYGRYLTFLVSTGSLSGATSPAERISRQLVAQYIGVLREQVASKTLAGRIIDLGEAIRVMSPGSDIEWLRRLGRRLSSQITPVRNKHSRIVPIDQLFDLGVDLMERSKHDRGPRPSSASVQFRDGLMIALLAARPFRLRTFWRLRVGRHLRRSGDGYLIQIWDEDAKTGRGDVYPLPQDLPPYVDDYLNRVRPLLLNGRDSDKLWISWAGDDLSECGIHDKIEERTKARFGHAINPHLFRDCAATSIAIEDPEHVRIIKSILGHTSLETSQRFYNQGQSMSAQRDLNRAVLSRRKRHAAQSHRRAAR
ncbi:site-specific integrase [Thalassobaculum sp. OXR-137]|uniref:site-specific integrase n=1 Tax=Thalassobaculum sp. OXR-137 TaxID=3100173 RepID=UPI002AC8EEF7|nr:site-specific integrase [Thalassobaculum sp. OXR-137]WPZ34045.1 site-specific integrase [Thalassobaculum sp. OXR-137]